MNAILVALLSTLLTILLVCMIGLLIAARY
jgi:hypothetical protein